MSYRSKNANVAPTNRQSEINSGMPIQIASIVVLWLTGLVRSARDPRRYLIA